MEIFLKKQEIVLAALATGKEASYSPVQVQKLLFLIDRNIPYLIEGPIFNFKPYDYGPFDSAVYETVEELAQANLVNVLEVPGRKWAKYSLTEEGQTQGTKLLDSLKPKAKNYIGAASEFVLSLNFAELVSAIYKAYPDMKENSVF